jgi:hypothetical protein
MSIIKGDTWAIGIGFWVEFRLVELYFGPYTIYFTNGENLP